MCSNLSLSIQVCGVLAPEGGGAGTYGRAGERTAGSYLTTLSVVAGPPFGEARVENHVQQHSPSECQGSPCAAREYMKTSSPKQEMREKATSRLRGSVSARRRRRMRRRTVSAGIEGLLGGCKSLQGAQSQA